MRPLSFIPGPTKISSAVYHDIENALASGFLELSHRSEEFTEITEQCLTNLRSLLSIPPSYHIFYLGSASEAWHAQITNTVEMHSTHIVTGHFSHRAADAAKQLYKETSVHTVDVQQQNISLPDTLTPSTELVTLCYSESSTGAGWTNEELTRIKDMAPDALLSVDITSVASAIPVPISEADIWYFSIQKAFGLPSGMGILVVSPRAMARSEQLHRTKRSLAGLYTWSELASNYTRGRGLTIHTPNMLGVYLLTKQCERYLNHGGISALADQTINKLKRITNHIDHHDSLEFYVPNQTYRSPTVITLTAEPKTIESLHEQANSQNMRLGKGYGDLQDSTIRIANFPSITDEDISSLLSWL